MSWHPRPFRSLKTSSRISPLPSVRSRGPGSRACHRAARRARDRPPWCAPSLHRESCREGIEEDHRTDGVQRPRLPRRDLRRHRVGDAADEVGRHLREKRLNLAHGQAADRERTNLVGETREASFVRANQPRFKRALAVARHVDRYREFQTGPALRPALSGVCGACRA